MSEPVIRLDKSKAFSECRGERTPDDPHYKVHFWQGGMFNKRMVLLPFDAQGILVPDDGKKEPYAGLNVDSKPIEYRPLYDQFMRDLVALKLKKSASAAKGDDQTETDGGDGEPAETVNDNDVNLESWLRGEARYAPHQVRAAVKERFHRSIQKISDIVVDLVLDEKLVLEADVCTALAGYLPGAKAA